MQSRFQEVVSNTTFINNGLLMAFFVIFVGAIIHQSMSKTNQLKWTDLVTDSKTGRFSIAKVGQFWGAVIGSWLIVHLANTTDAYPILPMVFTAYLAFLGGSWGFNQFLKTKQPKDPTPPESPQ